MYCTYTPVLLHNTGTSTGTVPVIVLAISLLHMNNCSHTKESQSSYHHYVFYPDQLGSGISSFLHYLSHGIELKRNVPYTLNM